MVNRIVWRVTVIAAVALAVPTLLFVRRWATHAPPDIGRVAGCYLLRSSRSSAWVPAALLHVRPDARPIRLTLITAPAPSLSEAEPDGEREPPILQLSVEDSVVSDIYYNRGVWEPVPGATVSAETLSGGWRVRRDGEVEMGWGISSDAAYAAMLLLHGTDLVGRGHGVGMVGDTDWRRYEA